MHTKESAARILADSLIPSSQNQSNPPINTGISISYRAVYLYSDRDKISEI